MSIGPRLCARRGCGLFSGDAIHNNTDRPDFHEFVKITVVTTKIASRVGLWKFLGVGLSLAAVAYVAFQLIARGN